MIASIDWRRLSEYSPRAAASPRIAGLIPAAGAAVGPAAKSEIIAALAASSETARPAILGAYLSKALGRVLSVPPAEIDPERSFDSLGLDSLLAVELTIVVNQALGAELSVVPLLDGMTVRRLTGLVLSQIDLNSQAPSQTATVPTIDPVVLRQAPIETPSILAASARSEIRLPAEPSLDNAAHRTNGVDYRALDYTKWSPRQNLARSISRLAFRALGTVDIDGEKHLPKSGPFILAVNHLSMADVPLALTIMPRRTIILANERLRRSLILDWLVAGVGQAIYLQKGEQSPEALASARIVLEMGGIIALSPEGTRSRGGLIRGKTGVAWLVQNTGVPVIPYVAWGQERWRERFRQLQGLDVHVRIGAPVLPHDEAEGDGRLRAHTDRIMTAMANLLPPSYRGIYADAAESDRLSRTLSA
jgi:1-acyl-sn-glycerol-3-phosphate acyltransferase